MRYRGARYRKTRGGGGAGSGSLISQGVHPRLWFTTSANSYGVPTTAEVRANMANFVTGSGIADIDGQLNTAIADCEADMANAPTVLSAQYRGPMHALLSQVLKAGALGGSTKTAQEHGDRAIALLDAWANGVGGNIGDGNWPTPGFPLIYDWAYDSLIRLASTYPTLKATCHTLMQDMMTRWDGLYAGAWAADSSKYGCGAMMCAAASSGDGDSTHNTQCTTYLGYYTTRWISATGVLGEESRLANLGPTTFGAGAASGLNYTNYQWPGWVQASEAIRTANTTQTRSQFYDATEYSAVPGVLVFWTKSIAPYARSGGSFPGGYDWTLVRTNYSDLCMGAANPTTSMPVSAFAGIWKDVDVNIARLAMWYQRQRIGAGFGDATADHISKAWVPRFVLEDPSVTETTPASYGLPLSAAHGDGRYEFRSGYDSTATNSHWQVRFYASKYLVHVDGRSPHEMNGHYSIHYKGPATMIRGAGVHIWNHHGAFNTVYFRDTQFTPPFHAENTGSPDFGADLAGRVITYTAPHAGNRGNDLVPNSSADFLDESRVRLSSGASFDSDYVFADMTRFHASTVTNGWTNANNPGITLLHHVHLCVFRSTAGQPVRVVKVHRYATTSTRFEPTLIWNPSADAITVSGTESTGIAGRYVSAGHWVTTNSSRATAVNNATYGTLTYDNKNVLTVIRPSAVTMVRAGGPDPTNGLSFYDPSSAVSPSTGWDSISTAYSREALDIYGQPFTQLTNSTGDTQAMAHEGRWHIQVQPTTMSTRGDICIVNEVIPNASGTPSTTAALTNLAEFAGVAITSTSGSFIFAYGSSGDLSTGRFTVPEASTYHMKIANLSGSARTVSVSGGSISLLEDGSGASGNSFTVHAASKTLDFNFVASSANTVVTVS